MSLEEFSDLSCAQLLARYESLCDLHPWPEARAELDRALRAEGLDLAFWTYESRQSSSFGHKGEKREPVLHLNFRTTAALRAEQGIDPHRGNWDDGWVRTNTLRDMANSILARHGLPEDFCSPQSFIFPLSWEETCWHKIAVESEPSVKSLVTKLVLGRWHGLLPGNKHYPSVYSGSAWDEPAPGAFNIVFERKEQMERAQDMIDEIAAGCRDILRRGRHDGYIENFDVAIRLWCQGMDMPPLYRRD